MMTAALSATSSPTSAGRPSFVPSVDRKCSRRLRTLPTPCLLWAGDPLRIQPLRDGTRRAARRELGEDPAHHCRLCRLDLASATARLAARIMLVEVSDSHSV